MIVEKLLMTKLMFLFCLFIDIFVVTRGDDEVSEVFAKLKDSLFQVLNAVTEVEASTKMTRCQIEPNRHLKATDC